MIHPRVIVWLLNVLNVVIHCTRDQGVPPRGGGVGALLNNSIKLTTRLMPVYVAESLESMELIITIVSISVRLVIVYRMPHSKESIN